jgi:hypothetical protein
MESRWLVRRCCRDYGTADKELSQVVAAMEQQF